MPDSINKTEVAKFIKFAVTGGINTLVDFAVYTFLTAVFSVNIFAAQTAGYCAGTLNSYIINRSWTFKSDTKFLSPTFVKFIIANLITLGISLVILPFIKEQFGLSDIVAKIPVMTVTVVVNFLLSRLWVFRQRKNPEKTE